MNGVSTEISNYGTWTICNVEMGSILDIGRTLGTVKILVEVTSSWESAFLWWHPQVWWSSIENYTESLGWSSDPYLPVILSIEIVQYFNLRVSVDVRQLFVWEQGWKCFHHRSDNWTVVHIFNEHLWFIRVSHSMFHFNLLDACRQH